MILAEAMNTYNIVLHTIKEKGYTITLESHEEQDDMISWLAIRDSIKISAFNPLSLLALITIFEEYGENWNKQKIENLYEKILEQDSL